MVVVRAESSEVTAITSLVELMLVEFTVDGEMEGGDNIESESLTAHGEMGGGGHPLKRNTLHLRLRQYYMGNENINWSGGNWHDSQRADSHKTLPVVAFNGQFKFMLAPEDISGNPLEANKFLASVVFF